MKQPVFLKVPVTEARLASLAQEAANKRTDLIDLAASKLAKGPIPKKAKKARKSRKAA